LESVDRSDPEQRRRRDDGAQRARRHDLRQESQLRSLQEKRNGPAIRSTAGP
jgi:hypothetical protein